MERSETATYTFGRFQLDSAERRLSRDGEAIPLTPKAFDTLLTLVQRAEHALTKDELMRAVWPDGFVEEVNLAYNISILRKALSAADEQAGEKYIETIPKVGYRFVAAVSEAQVVTRRRTNLPAQLTRFIGRERELAEVVRVVNEKRLVTLTGAAGMGKTRLALETGAHVLTQFPDGVWLAELAPLADGALVPSAVASTFGLSEQPGRSLAEALIAFIAERHLLIILDNCEHVIEASARLAESLLRACPNLRILATSREALRLPGEVTWRVPPLSMPEPANLPSLDRMAEYDAVQLFVEHAALTQPGFTLAPANLLAVAHICDRLDGMPLAIEMAAAQVADMGLSGVASGLDDRFALLTNGSRTAVPRHQTLRATLDWSYALLTEPERTLLARLSVFAGGWTADAVERVCGSSASTLLQLVRKSLVIPGQHEGQTRYRLLESVRQYANGKLRECGEVDETSDRHLAYFLDMAEETMDLGGPRAEAVVRRLEPEYDNVRAAFAWAMTREDAGEMALRLVGGLRPFWFTRGHVVEGQAWVDQALARGDATPIAARALLAKTSLCFAQGQVKQALAYAHTSLSLLQTSADSLGMAWCLEILANNLFDVRVQALAEQALGLFRKYGSLDGEGRALRALGIAALRSGQHARAAGLLQQSIATAPWGVMSCLGYLYDADPMRAMDVCSQERERLIEAGDAERIASVLTVQSALFTAKGDYAQAKHSLEESVRWWLRVDDLIKQKWDLPTDLRASKCAEPFLAIWVFDRNYFHYTLLSLGLVEIFLGDAARARVWLDQVCKFAHEAGNTLVHAAAQLLMASILIHQREIMTAATDSLAYLQRFHQLGYRPGSACSLIQVAEVARQQGHMTKASILLGAAHACSEEIDILPLWLNRLPSLWHCRAQETIIAPTLAAARAALGDAEFEAAYAAGQRMTLDEAVALALIHE